MQLSSPSSMRSQPRWMGLHDVCRLSFYVHYQNMTLSQEQRAKSPSVLFRPHFTPLGNGRYWDQQIERLFRRKSTFPEARSALRQWQHLLTQRGLTIVDVQVFLQVGSLGTYVDVLCRNAAGLYVLVENKIGYAQETYKLTQGSMCSTSVFRTWPCSVYYQHQLYLYLIWCMYQRQFPHHRIAPWSEQLVIVSHPTLAPRVYTGDTQVFLPPWSEVCNELHAHAGTTRRQRRCRITRAQTKQKQQKSR